MDIKYIKIILVIAGVLPLSLHCKKRKDSCPKEGYEYITTNSKCWYYPEVDSIPVGDVITLEASVPKTFVDETTNTIVTNTAPLIHGSLGIGMVYPQFKAAADSFEITAQVGKVIKDTNNFSSEMLKGFRTIEWDNNSADSFKMKITIKALSRGIYSFSLKQQSYKDKDCALYKYFLSPGNSDRHLDYWMRYVGNVSEEVNFFTYCIKVY